MSAPARPRFPGRVETPPDASGTARSGDGTRIAWRAYGEGEPVVLVMGFMGSGHAWFRLLPHIAARRRALGAAPVAHARLARAAASARGGAAPAAQIARLGFGR